MVMLHTSFNESPAFTLQPLHLTPYTLRTLHSTLYTCKQRKIMRFLYIICISQKIIVPLQAIL